MRISLAFALSVALGTSQALAQSSAPPSQESDHLREWAAAANIPCNDLRECRRALREHSEQRAPAGAAFEHMTPHDHFIEAQRVLREHECGIDGQCNDADVTGVLDELLRHVRAIVASGNPYVAMHATEVRNLMATVQAINAQRHSDTAAAAERGSAPQPNERGGNYREIRAWMRTHLDNPSSYQPVNCQPAVADREGWDVTCSFRARNRFNAVVLNEWVFIFVHGRIVYGGEGIPVGETLAEALGL